MKDFKVSQWLERASVCWRCAPPTTITKAGRYFPVWHWETSHTFVLRLILIFKRPFSHVNSIKFTGGIYIGNLFPGPQISGTSKYLWLGGIGSLKDDYLSVTQEKEQARYHQAISQRTNTRRNNCHEPLPRRQKPKRTAFIAIKDDHRNLRIKAREELFFKAQDAMANSQDSHLSEPPS